MGGSFGSRPVGAGRAVPRALSGRAARADGYEALLSRARQIAGLDTDPLVRLRLLPELLLARSATMAGFFLPLHARHFKRHFARLVGALEGGRLRVLLDEQRFVGLEAVAADVDRLQSGESAGKVFVQVGHSLPAAVVGAGPAARL